MSRTRTIGDLLTLTRETAIRLQAKGQSNICMREVRAELQRLRSLLCMFCDA